MLKLYRRDSTPYPDGPEGLAEWSKDLNATKHVRETVLPNGLWVSTVWLGITIGGVPPSRFETACFDSKGINAVVLDEWHYSTEVEAIVGHEAMCAKWQGFRKDHADADSIQS